MSKKRITAAQTLRWALAAVVLVLVTAYGVTWFNQQQIMEAKTADIAALEKQLADIRLQIAALESDLQFAQTDAYKERLVREELEFVKEGEIKFVLQDDKVEQTEE